MKQLVITFICLMFLVISENVFAYLIKTADKTSYQFQNGKYIGDNNPYVALYEVDLDAGVVLEKVAEVNIDGTQIDMAALTVNKSKFKIISNDDGQIVAVSITPHGEQMLTLKNDGTFHFYQTLYALQDYSPLKKGDNFSVVSFGKYSLVERE